MTPSTSSPSQESHLGVWDYVRRFFRKPLWHFLSVEGKFARVYRNNKWRDPESVSGPGSSLAQTETIRRELPVLLRDLQVESMLDLPCGDFNWLKEVNLPLQRYIGGDIVGELVDCNQEKYGDGQRCFQRINLLDDELPQVDLVLCRDCLVHFSFADIERALERIRASGAGYLLTTTYARLERNRDILTGEWRTLNLELPPFGFPPPLRMIDEQCPDPRYCDKHLALWRLSSLSIRPADA